jgi:methyl-accepting chemotaxis protein
LLLTFLVTIVILAVLLIRFAGDIVFPLQKTVSMAKELKHGRVGSRLDVGRRNDEFADMAAALNAFAEDLQGEVVAALQALSQGNLNVKVFPFDDQDQVRAALQKTVNDLNALLGQVQTISERISLSSSQVASSSQTLSEGACRSASSLEQISASLNELSSQTRLNAENAMQADTLAGQANVLAQNGSGHMSDMMTAMEEINRASQNISKIIKVIDEIAFQTNLLALNAAVEAARAGQHGKGFAVVAEEVRSLAARSAKSAAETAQLIEGAVSKAQNGSKIADATAGALSEIVGVVGKVSGLVGDINAASREQAEGIAQVNASLAQIDQVTQQNTASAEESAAAAEELSAQAHQLRRMLAHFTLG